MCKSLQSKVNDLPIGFDRSVYERNAVRRLAVFAVRRKRLDFGFDAVALPEFVATAQIGNTVVVLH